MEVGPSQGPSGLPLRDTKVVSVFLSVPPKPIFDRGNTNAVHVAKLGIGKLRKPLNIPSNYQLFGSLA
jgi:hypothetical protein